MSQNDRSSTSFIIPDFFPYCNNFPLSYNVHGDEVAKESDDWVDINCPDLNVKQRRDLRGLHAGQLTAYCYNTAPRNRLRVVSDFLNYLFHLCDFFYIEALWYIANQYRFSFIAETILATGCWLVRPTSLQMLSWTPFGSMTSICPPIVLVRSNRRLRTTLESSHESKFFINNRPILLSSVLIFNYFLLLS